MNNDCGVSTVMNTCVTFSVILSLLALLSLPSVCLDDGNKMQNNSSVYNAPSNQYTAYYTAYYISSSHQDAFQNDLPNQNNSYYSAHQEISQNNSSNRNHPIIRVYFPPPNISTHFYCLLPEQPKGGHYELSGCAEPCSKRPNDLVIENSVLFYTCKDNYILSGNRTSICIKTKWTELPWCLKIDGGKNITQNNLSSHSDRLNQHYTYSINSTHQDAFQNGLPDHSHSHYNVSPSSLPDQNYSISRIYSPPPNVTVRFYCLLPEQPENGHYELSGCTEPCSKHPNDLVIENSVLIYTCKDNYILRRNSTSVCIKTKWTESPWCLKSNNEGNITQPNSYNDSLNHYAAHSINHAPSEISENSSSNPNYSTFPVYSPPPIVSLRFSCPLPEQPEGGHYELNNCAEPCSKRPNDLVIENSILIYTCKDKYTLSGNTISVCIKTKWSKPPSCLKICPSLKSTSVDISCIYQGELVSCSKDILPGTSAMLSCKPSYILPTTTDPAYRKITCLDDGLWDNRVFRCLPECGTSIANGIPLIVNGRDAKVGVFPWHVGIYERIFKTNKYEQICGGTLISSNLVLSAAHCFYDEVFNKVYDTSKYSVSAGKYYRDWDAKENYVQKSSVESIRISDRYLGFRGNFADDIALLKLKKPFELTTLVRPICMDWSNQYEREHLQEGQVGKVVGWGKDINGESTKNLQEINLPYIPYHRCLSEMPLTFRGFITYDKFCAGYLNGSSVCDGDSGGGICFEKNGIWYLRGIVSVSPEKRGTCDYNAYVGFTRVSNSYEWIRQAYITAL